MDLIKRIGTQKKKFKLQFFIGRLKFSSFQPGKVYIVLRRGNHKVKSQQKLQMPQDCKVNFNKEILEIQVTLYFDQTQNKYQEKHGQLDIVMIDPKGNKILIGIVSFDVGQYANAGQEAIKEKREIQQTPKGFQGLVEYNVFIKYIGEGSQSSLDKVADFFFGKSKDPESEKKVTSKNQISSKQKIQDETKKGSAKEIAKTQTKKGTNIDFYEIEGPINTKQKNYVTTAKARQGSRQFVQDNDQLAKNFYLDDAQPDNNKEKKPKKTKQKSTSVEKKKENRGKGDSQKIIAADRDSDRKQNGKQKGGSKKQTSDPIKFTSQQETISELKAQLKELQKNYGLVQYQLSDMNHHTNVIRAHNEKLQKQLAQCKQQIKKKDQQLQEQRAFHQNKQPSGDSELLQQVQSLQKQLKKVQKQKNQLLVQISKLKQKHKQDIKKYEQLLQQHQSTIQTKTDSTKADVLKLREQCSQYRQNIEKLTKQKNDKHQELIKQKTENKAMQEQLSQVKTNLSKIKLKICMKLNDVQGRDDLAEILMDLNKDD